MALPFRTRSEVVADALPLASDPSVAAANAHQPAALKALRVRGEVEGLVIPADASLIRIRSLDKRLHAEVERAAGRISHLGQLVAARIAEACRAVGEGPEHSDARELEAARILDAATDEEAAAWSAHVAWSSRIETWTVIYGLVHISGELAEHHPDERGRYPAHVIEVLAEVAPEAIAEIAGHVRRLSELSSRGKAPSGGPSGSATTTPPDGAATSAPPSPDCGSGEATAEAPSGAWPALSPAG